MGTEGSALRQWGGGPGPGFRKMNAPAPHPVHLGMGGLLFFLMFSFSDSAVRAES